MTLAPIQRRGEEREEAARASKKRRTASSSVMREAHQTLVERKHRIDVELPPASPADVGRLQRRLDLQRSDAPQREGVTQQALGLVDRRRRPERQVLFLERHVHVIAGAARFAARVGEEHQREQAVGLGLVGGEREGLTLRAIVEKLCAEGYRTRRGGQWAAETVRKLIVRAEEEQAATARSRKRT